MEGTPEVEKVIVDAIRELLVRRADGKVDVDASSNIYEDLRLDSLEIAELSALLEDTFGNDPYSEGVVPTTVGELVGFYRQ